MIFDDIEITFPKFYPKSVLENEKKLILYNKGTWENECFKIDFLNYLPIQQLNNRYYQILENYYVFANEYNDVIPIENCYSSWFWTKKLYQLMVCYRVRKIDIPIDTLKHEMKQIYRTCYKPKIFKLFRFCELDYNLRFIMNGQIRFAAAKNYIKDENDSRNDNEIKKKYVYSGTGSTIITQDGQRIPCIGEAETIFETSQYYLFCLSLQYNPLFYKKMPNYDSCVIIHDVQEFCKRVTLGFRKRFNLINDFILPSPVNYYDMFSKNSSDNKLVPALDKDIKFAWQEEFRFVGIIERFTEDYFFLNIGSLKDIAEILIVKPRSDVEDILKKYT